MHNNAYNHIKRSYALHRRHTQTTLLERVIVTFVVVNPGGDFQACLLYTGR
jgi:hypothetical protein